MWTLLGMIVLAIVSVIIGLIVTETTKNKIVILMTGYLLGAIVIFILGCRCFTPEIEKYETKVNKLTTELYESYNVRDSLEQELPRDVLKEDK